MMTKCTGSVRVPVKTGVKTEQIFLAKPTFLLLLFAASTRG
jgi:hypothetical protein